MTTIHNYYSLLINTNTKSIILKIYLFIFQEIKPKAGIWKADKFVKAVPIQKWVVLNLDRLINNASIK